MPTPANHARVVIALTVAALGGTACVDDPGSADGLGLAGPEVGFYAVAANVPGTPTLLLDGLQGASGSAIGPDGQLYVTEGAAGKVSRVNPETGEVTTLASGFPPSIIGIGGATDIAFIGQTAYVLVTLVDDPLFPTGQINGIYRVDGPNDYTVIADLGAYNLAHPPSGFDFFVQTGVLYALETYRGGFLVTDGHLNRVLHVALDGEITQFIAFGNVVPTGLEVSGNTVYMAEAGPVPHEPEDGKIVAFGPNWPATQVASGGRLLVDVERDRGRTMFALSQGVFGGGDPGSPALDHTGALLRLQGDGTFAVVADGLNIPTSLEFIGTTAYVVSLVGEIWTIDNVAGPPYGEES